jgi:hypothetical protein
VLTGLSKAGTHLLFGLSIGAFGACQVILVRLVDICDITVQIRWYREGDVDPKFKKLVWMLGASLTLLCIVANIYFWAPTEATTTKLLH